MAYTTYTGTITGARTHHTESQTHVDNYSSWYTGSAITNTYNIGSGSVSGLGAVYNRVQYRVNVDPHGGVIKNVVVKGYAYLPLGGRRYAMVHVDLNGSAGTPISGSLSDSSYTSDYSGNVTYTVSVTSGGDFLTSGTIYVEVSDINRNSDVVGSSTFRITSVQIQTAPPDLTLSISPASAIAGDTVTANVTGRFGRVLNIVFSANDTDLTTVTTGQDSTPIATEPEWFDRASITGNTMTATVTVTDPEDDRTASTTIQLTRPQPLSATATAPKSTTVEGGESITFAWSVTGTYGTQNLAELQYSYDNANWSSLGSVSGAGATFTKSAAFFRPGTVYWQVRVRSTYGLYSNWSSSANFTVRYSATSYVVPLNSPTGGNVNAAEPITFAGTLLSDGVPYEPFTMAAATFYWRSRTADPYTEVSMTPDGANASVVIPGGTFPSGTVYWYIAATDNVGTSTQTEVYTISTIASKIDASPVDPVGVIETKNTPTTFSWRYATVTGSEQKAAELQYSTDGGSTWLELGSVQGAETSYTAPANALPSGTITWRVRAENAADEWGEWSEPVSFVNFGAPDVTSVLTDGKPYTTITWQVNDQESYKLIVDGVQIGPYHGEDVRSYTLSQPLADGQHTVQVQVQNEYSQWSPINGTVFDVVNTPGTAITLSHSTDVDVELTWTAGDGTGNYYVYRDGVPIAHTGEMAFVDRVALGAHEYYVIERLASGDYTRSNTVTATPGVGCSPMIAPLAGGEWLPLALSLDSDRVIQISDEVRTSERFVLGADFPVVTIGRHRTRRVSLDAAWLRSSIRNDEFMALLGKAVIIKLPWGDVFVGVLPAYAQSNARITSGYAYSISQADWRDYIDNA